MCGIAGFVGKGDNFDLERMTRSLTHRGPDDEGYHCDPERNVYFGHRRLIIRDRRGGCQPMWDSNRSICVIFNGEIYNNKELRDELTSLGHTFTSSHSDTEVLVYGYAQWGRDLARRLNGMFAFAILDTKRNTIYAARDRFGEKPFYYAQASGIFAFASELTALMQHSGLQSNLSHKALQKFFGYGYFPGSTALFEHTYKLPGGHYMIINLDDQQINVTPYWQFVLEPDEDFAARGTNALAEELRFLFLQSVERRLVSDAPIGIFLSGGIDSSSIAAAASQFMPRDLMRTFTIGFNEPSYNESDHAETMAKYLGSHHSVEMLDLRDARDLIPSLLSKIGEPVGDPSIVPTYLLSRFTSQHVTVALSGDGGDELFAGYDPFAALSASALYSSIIPPMLHNLLRRAAEHIPKSSKNMSLDFKIRRALQGLSYPESLWAPVWMAPLEPSQMADLFCEPMRIEDVYSEAMDVWESGPAKHRVDRLLQFFTVLYLQDNILNKVDRSSMLCSLETRAIFLDNDLVSFCQKLPHRFKYRHGARKYLLKQAVKDLLPNSIVKRKKKGFGIPLNDWMKTIPPEPPLEPINGVNTKWASAAWDDHRSGKYDHRLLLWNWLALQQSL